jgi:hypothetical protein
MPHPLRTPLFSVIVAILGWGTAGEMAHGAEWQWSVSVKASVSSETEAPPRAFLWIPPTCQRVRAVVIGQHNMEEEPILEHAVFRHALSELNFAAVWVSPGLDFAFGEGAGDVIMGMLKSLAAESGYAELATAPVVPIGHSAAAGFPWKFAAWSPRRTLAAITVSGEWPNESPVDGVPGLATMGEYEWAADRSGEGLRQRAAHPHLALSFLAEPGGGHFDVSDEKIAFLALYLRKAAQYRLREDRLVPIDPAATGCQGANGFWYFDEELAGAADNFRAEQRGKKPQLVGYVQDGRVVEQVRDTHQQVTLRFLPIDDGLTFKLTGTFLDTVPAGRPEKWTKHPAGSSIEHAAAGPVTISRICGPVAQLAPDTFAIRFDRVGTDNKKRSNEIWLRATHPGDAEFKSAVQQSKLHFPLRNTGGAPQRITFPPIVPPTSCSGRLKLTATSDSGAPVHYYVREGPAEIEDGALVFTQIPSRARLPMKCTVVAWQWGRSIEPRLQTAEPVEQTFSLMP